MGTPKQPQFITMEQQAEVMRIVRESSPELADQLQAHYNAIGLAQFRPEILGQVAFDAYNADRGGLNHLGEPTPEWEDLPEGIQRAWGVAAAAAVSRSDQLRHAAKTGAVV